MAYSAGVDNRADEPLATRSDHSGSTDAARAIFLLVNGGSDILNKVDSTTSI